MKKVLLFIFLFCLFLPTFAATDKYCEEYLKSKKNISFINPIAEAVVQKAIKRSISKEAEGKYKVRFKAYNTSSLKKGVFKYLEIKGKNINTNGIEIPYFKIETITDYNRIDYTQKPVIFKSNIVFESETILDEKAINQALQTSYYKKIMQKLNNKLYPLLIVSNISVKIKNEKVYITLDYNFPISPMHKNKTIMISTKFCIDNGKIKTYDIEIDNKYGNLPISKITNLVNLIDPLSFTLKLIDSKNCDGKIENIIIEDDLVKINGKIYIEGDEK